MLTLGRQAGLGKFLISTRDRVVADLRSAEACLDGMATVSSGAPNIEFLNVASLGASYSYFEAYFLDIAEEMLRCFPEKMKNSDIKLHDALKDSSALIDVMADKQMNQLGYKKFTDVLSVVHSYFNDKTFSSTCYDQVSEFKATRDVYFHNGGYWNSIYQTKAGPNARPEPHPRRPLPLDNTYLKQGLAAMITVVTDFHASGPRQMERFNRAKSFAEMWKMCALNPLVQLNDAWDIDLRGDMVRPKEKAETWGWSGSENYLYDFFKLIYGGKRSEGRNSELHEALYRWPAASPSGQIIMSWLSSPFYF